jgi:hypothetical protein
VLNSTMHRCLRFVLLLFSEMDLLLLPQKKTAAEFFSRIACVANDRARPLLALLDARVHARTVFGYSHLPCPPCPPWSRWPLVSR